jgi:hypothetical protein
MAESKFGVMVMANGEGHISIGKSDGKPVEYGTKVRA